MDKIIRGLELPPTSPPDARDLVKRWVPLHLVLPPPSLPGPACVPESPLGRGCWTPTLLTHTSLYIGK